MHHWRQPRGAGPTSGALGLSGQMQMERTSGAGICCGGLRWRGVRLPEWFGGCTSKDIVEQRQMRSAPGVGGCNAMKGLIIKSCPAQTEKNARDCLKKTRRHFSWGQHWPNKRLESGCTDKVPQEFPWSEGIPIWRCSTPELLWSSAQTLPSARHGWWLR